MIQLVSFALMRPHAFVDNHLLPFSQPLTFPAAVKEGDSNLGLLVFAAIMLHKAPGE